jgi:hypothetical protein
MTSINCPILVKSLRVTWDMKNIKQAEQAAPRSQQLIINEKVLYNLKTSLTDVENH